MNAKLKGRLFGVVAAFFFAGCLVFNWYLLINKGYFYPKISFLCPTATLFSLALIGFPLMAYRQNRADKKSIAVMLIAGVIGLLIGGINFYLMDSYHP